MRALAWISAFLTSVENHKNDERGAAFTEYVVLVAAVVAAFAGLLLLIGPALVAKLQAAIALI